MTRRYFMALLASMLAKFGSPHGDRGRTADGDNRISCYSRPADNHATDVSDGVKEPSAVAATTNATTTPTPRSMVGSFRLWQSLKAKLFARIHHRNRVSYFIRI